MCRPDKSHPTFPVFFNTNDLTLRTALALHIFDLPAFLTGAVLHHLIFLLGPLADDDLAPVGLALVAQGALLSFQSANLGFEFGFRSLATALGEIDR